MVGSNVGGQLAQVLVPVFFICDFSFAIQYFESLRCFFERFCFFADPQLLHTSRLTTLPVYPCLSLFVYLFKFIS